MGIQRYSQIRDFQGRNCWHIPISNKFFLVGQWESNLITLNLACAKWPASIRLVASSHPNNINVNFPPPPPLPASSASASASASASSSSSSSSSSFHYYSSFFVWKNDQQDRVNHQPPTCSARNGRQPPPRVLEPKDERTGDENVYITVCIMFLSPCV